MIYYFDYNATHPPFQEILKDCLEDYSSNYFNPSGATRFSLSRQASIEEARTYFSKVTGKERNGFVFSSTGTESNHLLAFSLKANGYKKIITSSTEHSSVYGSIDYYGYEKIMIGTNLSGIVDLNQLEETLKKEPSPVFILWVGNETGVIQPMHDIYKICKKYGAPLFSDLMQGYGKIPLDFSILDGFTFSAHKIGGGMGASLSWISPKLFTEEVKLFRGGNQENGHRAGTENSFAIKCFHKASEIQYRNMEEKNNRLILFREEIETCLKDCGAEIVSENSNRISSTTFAILPYEDLDFLMMGLEEKNIAISTGSSCKSRARQASSTLLRMGYDKEKALKAVRISTGIFTTSEEVSYLKETLKILSKSLALA
jgi:cysteine desulfurase